MPTLPAPRPRPTVIPHIVRWSEEETVLFSLLTVRPDSSGLAYRDETPQDRDARGVLWGRVSAAPGQGKPRFREMHTARQRHAMLDLLCQVCAGPASRTRAGWLFLLNPPASDRQPGWPDSELTVQPPLCLPCADQATQQCPNFADGHVAVRVRKPVTYGVYGNLFARPGLAGLREVGEGASLRYGDPATRWLVASQLILELRRTTVVDLAAELTAQEVTA